MDYYKYIVNKLRNPDNIQEPDSLIYKCLVYKYEYSSNKYSIHLEKTLKKLFNLKNKENNTSGDALSISGKKIEIKISLCGPFYNYVQIRPSHDIDYYLFLAYDVNKEVFGKVYLFLFDSDNVYDLIPTFGQYSHGTVKINGKIDLGFNKNLEYSLRPSSYEKNKKSYSLWQRFLDNEKTIEEINDILNT